MAIAAATAASGHNLLISGHMDVISLWYIKMILTILTAMEEEQALEVTKIYSVAGLLKSRDTLITESSSR